MGEAKRRKALDPNWGRSSYDRFYETARKEMVREIREHDGRQALAIEAMETGKVLACLPDEAFFCWTVVDPEEKTICEFGATAKQFFSNNKGENTVLAAFMLPDSPGCVLFAIDRSEILTPHQIAS